MAAKERVCWICMLSICFVLGWSVFCWADFYVIAAGKRAKKTVLVSPKSTETESGEALLNALAQISLPSESNPYLIIIEPGVYDIGGESLQMKSYVDIQGSGQDLTKIKGNIGFASTAVLRGANNAELRFLTVENTGGGTFAEAIYNSSQSPAITNVTATASGGSYLNVGIHNYNSSSVMTNVTASASGGGTDIRGVFNVLGTPVMAHVTATASGGTYNYGVYNDASTPEMKDVTASASGGTTSIGVNNGGGSFTMTDCNCDGGWGNEQLRGFQLRR